ncbi:MAG: hypothetical protein EAZ30_11960, partial [Betaproteobacteria bacterium]
MAGSATAAATDCTLAGAETRSGLTNNVTLSASNGTTIATACAPANTPANVTTTKTITAGPTATANPNQYTITYQIDAVNAGGSATSYALTDTPRFGAGVTINSATCVASTPSGTPAAPTANCNGAITLTNGSATTIAAAASAINAATTHRYSLTVTFTVDPATVVPASNGATCATTTPAAGTSTGLNNVATITPTGGSAATSNVCAPTPAAITVAKVVTSGGGSNSPVVYTVTVTNNGAAGSYGVDDSPAFGVGITVTANPTCANTSSPAAGDTTPTCTTTTGPWALADPGTAIAAATASTAVVHTYTVSIPFSVAGSATAAATDC